MHDLFKCAKALWGLHKPDSTAHVAGGTHRKGTSLLTSSCVPLIQILHRSGLSTQRGNRFCMQTHWKRKLPAAGQTTASSL